MKRLFLFVSLVLCALLFALTPVSLQLGDITVSYFSEYFGFFDGITDYTEAEIAWVTDGDTVSVLRSKTLKLVESVRLIGMDTPETVHPSKPVEFFGKEASDFAKKVLTDKQVILSYDWDPVDVYGRILAYLWIPVEYQGETEYVLFNLLAIINGYGHAYTTYAFNENYMSIFIEAERYARENSLGLWKEEALVEVPGGQSVPEIKTPKEETTPEYDPIVYITNTGTKYHRDGCRYLSESKIAIRLSEAIRRGYTPCSVCKP